MRGQLAIHESYTAPKWVMHRTGQWNGTPVRAGFLHSDILVQTAPIWDGLI